ncbi:hypothetical protein [Microbacterium sp. E-13]|uniref:hypothetical protein n=1 Tax=Microbacterium sp. E-13 TaxID=3404048 RepID=UPI003CFB0C34
MARSALRASKAISTGLPSSSWMSCPRRSTGAYGQLVIFAGDAVVTITADDHFGADRMAVFAVKTVHH